MRESEPDLIDDLILADDAVDRCLDEIVGPGWDEDVAVECTEGGFAGTSGVDRDVVDAGIFNHGGEGGLDVFAQNSPARCSRQRISSSWGVIGVSQEGVEIALGI